MRRIIPKSSKVKSNVFKIFSFLDIIFMTIGAFLSTSLILSNIQNKWLLIAIIGLALIILLFRIDDERIYQMIFANILHLTSKKTYRINRRANGIRELQTISKIENDTLYYKSKKIFSKVLEIEPTAFSLLSEEDQDLLISSLAKTFNVLDDAINSELHILKFDRPFNYEEIKKLNSDQRAMKLKEIYDKGIINHDEYITRLNVLKSNQTLFDSYDNEKILTPHYFLQILTDYPKQVDSMIEMLSDDLFRMKINNKTLNNHELALFVANSYSPYVEEKDIEKLDVYDSQYILSNLMPKDIYLKWNRAIVNKKMAVSHLEVYDYPIDVGNAWGFNAFRIPSTRATMKIKIIPRDKATKMMDKSMMNIKVKLIDKASESERQLYEMHYQSLRESQTGILTGIDNLFDVNFGLTVYDNLNSSTNKKLAKKTLANDTIRSNYSFGETLKWLVSDELTRNKVGKSVGITSNSLAATFPFIAFNILDDNGVFIGASGDMPCMFDVWKRDDDRVSSNMIVIGQSGSGKSFFVKTDLTQLALTNVKILIIDPDGEYAPFTQNLGGQVIDVASARGGKINPFEIVKELENDDDYYDDDNENTNVFYSQLQFLENFFNLIIQNLNDETMAYLKKTVKEMYNNFNINESTDFNELNSDNYPIFDDLHELVKQKQEEAEDIELKRIFRTLELRLSEFASGGTYSNLWNGHTTLRLNSNILNFVFKKLLDDKNKTLGNAQIMLLLRYFNNEISANKEYVEKTRNSRKIIIVVDEAHRFFSKEMTQALNFFSQMARQIRKFYGSIVFTTQNIGDFVSSTEVADKTTAILNACQYSFIFHLPPTSLSDLKNMYEDANNPLNDSEIDFIKNAERGKVFAILSDKTRVGMQVIAPPFAQELFGEIKNEELK